MTAAARIFAEKGFAGASIDDVADAAGYTKGAVYSNFASKTDLMLAVIEDRIRRQSEVVADSFAGVPLEQGLRELETRTPTGLDREWMMLIGEFMLYAMRHESARVALAKEYEGARRLSTAMIESKYVEAGATPPFPPRELAILVEALGIGLGFQALIDPASVPADLQAVAMERLLAPLVAGAARPSRPGGPPPPAKPRRPARPRPPTAPRSS